MTFQTPLVLLALVALPVLGAAYVLSQRRRRAYAVRFTNLALLGQVMGKGPGWRRHLPAALFLAGVAGLLLAMAGPAALISVPRERASVVLAVDVSGSMEASDVQPTRLQAARQAGRTLIDQLPGGVRVGLVSFNSAATVVAPLTRDHGSVEAALDALRPNGGTAIGDGLRLAVHLLVQEEGQVGAANRAPAMIVLLTDGSSNTGIAPLDAAGHAKEAGIPVETVGIGQRGQTTVVRGRPVDGVDETTLQSIADATGGHYFYAAQADKLQGIYGALGSRIGWRTETVDLTMPAVAIGTLVLLAAGLLSLRWFRLLP